MSETAILCEIWLCCQVIYKTVRVKYNVGDLELVIQNSKPVFGENHQDTFGYEQTKAGIYNRGARRLIRC